MPQKLLIALAVIIFASVLAYFSATNQKSKLAQANQVKCRKIASVCSPGGICGPKVVSVC